MKRSGAGAFAVYTCLVLISTSLIQGVRAKDKIVEDACNALTTITGIQELSDTCLTITNYFYSYCDSTDGGKNRFCGFFQKMLTPQHHPKRKENNSENSITPEYSDNKLFFHKFLLKKKSSNRGGRGDGFEPRGSEYYYRQKPAPAVPGIPPKFNILGAAADKMAALMLVFLLMPLAAVVQMAGFTDSLTNFIYMVATRYYE